MYHFTWLPCQTQWKFCTHTTFILTHHCCCYCCYCCCCSPPHSGCSFPCLSLNTSRSRHGEWWGLSPLESVRTQWPKRCCHHCLVNYLSLCPCSAAWSGPDELDLEMSVVECSLPHHQQKLFQTPQMCLHPATTLCQHLKSQISNMHIICGEDEVRRRYKVKEAVSGV